MKPLRRPAADHPAPPDRLPVPSGEEAPPTAVSVPTDIRSVALTILVVFAGILMLRYAGAVVIPIVLAVLMSYALEPLVARLTRVRVPRALAAAIVLFLVAGAGGTLLYQLRYEASEIVQQIPEAARRLRRTIERDGRQSSSTLGQVQQAATEIEKTANAAAPSTPPRGVTRVQVEEPPIRISEYLVWGSASLFTAAMQLVLIMFLAYFLLASGDLYRRKLVKIAGPSLTSKKITVQILEEISNQIERFLLVQMFTSLVVGIATWLVFRWIGIEQAGLWGLLAGVFNSIPYFGPVIVTSAVAVIAFLQFGTLSMVALAGGAAFVITTLEGILLTPWLTSRAARMNAVAVFVGLLFWSWVWDVWGMLLAVPMLMVVKAVCDRVEDLKGVGEMLGE